MSKPIGPLRLQQAFRRRTLAGGLAVAALLGLLHELWLPPVGGFLIVADPLRPADAIVALAGDSQRLYDAAKLLREGSADLLLVTDMEVPRPGGPGYADQAMARLIERGVPRGQIGAVAGVASSTYNEARLIRAAAEARGLRSLIVVTSPYHTRRSRLIFREVFRDSGIEVAVTPAWRHWYRDANWWRRTDGVWIVFSEYAKLALYLAGYRR